MAVLGAHPAKPQSQLRPDRALAPADPGGLIAAPNAAGVPKRSERFMLFSFGLRIIILDKRETVGIQLAQLGNRNADFQREAAKRRRAASG
jgi:hypothetical protein